MKCTYVLLHIFSIVEVYKLLNAILSVGAELAQSAERTTLNRVVEGSIPSFGGPNSFDILTALKLSFMDSASLFISRYKVAIPFYKST